MGMGEEIFLTGVLWIAARWLLLGMTGDMKFPVLVLRVLAFISQTALLAIFAGALMAIWNN